MHVCCNVKFSTAWWKPGNQTHPVWSSLQYMLNAQPSKQNCTMRIERTSARVLAESILKYQSISECTGLNLVQCRMQKKQPEIVFGPHIHFREHSLLDNPRMPATVKSRELQIRTCQVNKLPHLPISQLPIVLQLMKGPSLTAFVRSIGRVQPAMLFRGPYLANIPHLDRWTK